MPRQRASGYRPNPHHVVDLSWYFGEREAELGYRSNYGGFEAALSGLVGSSSVPEVPISGILAATREWAIRIALDQCVRLTQRVLAVNYTRQLWSPERSVHSGLAAIYGEREVGLALMSDAAHEAYAKANTAEPLPLWLKMRGDRGKLVDAIRSEVLGLSQIAHDNYDEAWHQTRALVRARQSRPRHPAFSLDASAVVD